MPSYASGLKHLEQGCFVALLSHLRLSKRLRYREYVRMSPTQDEIRRPMKSQT